MTQIKKRVQKTDDFLYRCHLWYLLQEERKTVRDKNWLVLFGNIMWLNVQNIEITFKNLVARQPLC